MSEAVRESLFGLRLWRLLSQRRPTFDTSIEQMLAVLAREAGVPIGELAAVIDNGAVPEPRLIRKLGPALGIHTADLFVIAGLPVPDELASAWQTSPHDVGSIVRHAARMDPDQRRRLKILINSLPATTHRACAERRLPGNSRSVAAAPSA